MEMARSKTNNKTQILRVQWGFQVYYLEVMHPVSSESQSLTVPEAMDSCYLQEQSYQRWILNIRQRHTTFRGLIFICLASSMSVWTVMLVASDWLFFKRQYEVEIFVFLVKCLKNYWTDCNLLVKFSTHIHVPLRMNHNNFPDFSYSATNRSQFKFV